MESQIVDPIRFCELCWPEVNLYDKQREILYSVRDNYETVVPAGNALGKDFVAALCAIWFFVSRRPARVVTTSVKHDQLNDVLWGEMRRFIDTSAVNLPIQYNHMHIRQVRRDGSFVPLCELVGQVVNKGEALLGRHLPKDIPRTLAIFDEASGIDDTVYASSDTWAHRKLIIGNPYPCSNFFYDGVKEGNKRNPVSDPIRGNLHRNVIRIKAEDSPNVQLAFSQIRQGVSPTGEVVIPGVIDYATYANRREIWDEVRQCIGLDGDFYEGTQILLYPPEWLNAAETRADVLEDRRRVAKAIGCDPAEGGDSSCWAVIDELGLIDLISLKTPDTMAVPNTTLALMRKYNVSAERVVFDRGGGGKQHADLLRSKGHRVRTVGFGESPTDPGRFNRHMKTKDHRISIDETMYVYKNRRAEMYGLLSEAINPESDQPFSLPARFTELRRQLSPIPRLYDGEGRLYLPSKNKRSPNSREQTLVEMLGCSPDEADALVLAYFGYVTKPMRRIAGAV